jgi:hypothetical protein
VPAVPASAALGSPAPHESAAVAVSAPWVLPQPAVSQGVDAGAASDAPVPAGNDKRRPRATRRSNKSCDPPYTTDEAGRVLFKVECM